MVPSAIRCHKPPLFGASGQAAGDRAPELDGGTAPCPTPGAVSAGRTGSVRRRHPRTESVGSVPSDLVWNRRTRKTNRLDLSPGETLAVPQPPTSWLHPARSRPCGTWLSHSPTWNVPVGITNIRLPGSRRRGDTEHPLQFPEQSGDLTFSPLPLRLEIGRTSSPRSPGRS